MIIWRIGLAMENLDKLINQIQLLLMVDQLMAPDGCTFN